LNDNKKSVSKILNYPYLKNGAGKMLEHFSSTIF